MPRFRGAKRLYIHPVANAQPAGFSTRRMRHDSREKPRAVSPTNTTRLMSQRFRIAISRHMLSTRSLRWPTEPSAAMLRVGSDHFFWPLGYTSRMCPGSRACTNRTRARRFARVIPMSYRHAPARFWDLYPIERMPPVPYPYIPTAAPEKAFQDWQVLSN